MGVAETKTNNHFQAESGKNINELKKVTFKIQVQWSCRRQFSSNRVHFYFICYGKTALL